MAVVKGPAYSQQASGTIGSTNFTRWRGLNIARAAATPIDPNTTKQINQRALMSTVAGNWGGLLTEPKRERWDMAAREVIAYDRLGGAYVPSGYQYYMKINLQAAFFGGGVQMIPPILLKSVYVGSASARSSPSVNAIIVRLEKETSVKVDADGFQVFKAGPYDSGGRRPIEPEYRHLALQRDHYQYVDFDVVDTKWYWYKMRWFFDVGFVGNWWEDQAQTDFP